MRSTVECLNRNEQIKEVSTIIDNAFHSETGYSIAINGEWGCGKTYFLKQLINKYSKEYFVFYYDCWANNYYDEPLYGLLDCLRKEINKNIKTQKIVEGVLVDALEIITNFFDGILESKIGFAPIKSINKIRGYINKKKKESLLGDDFNPYSNIDNAKKVIVEALSRLSSDQGKKVIIFIDELDRCDPRYSMKILERIHHIMNNTRTVVVVSVDNEQLKKSISTIYNFSDQDSSSEYLRKVVNYSYDLGNGKFDEAQHQAVFGELESLFLPCDGNLITEQDVIDYESAIFTEISIRKIERLVEATILNHKAIFGDKKVSRVIMCAELLLGWGLITFKHKKTLLTELSKNFSKEDYKIFELIGSKARFIHDISYEGKILVVRDVGTYLYFVIHYLNRTRRDFYFNISDQDFSTANTIFTTKYINLLLKTNI